MKPARLPWLFAFTSGVYLVPLEMKKWLPELFGGAAIQWGSTICTALLIPIGIILSINSLYSHRDQRRLSAFNCICFSLLFSIIIGFYSIASPLIVRLKSMSSEIASNHKAAEVIFKLQTSDSLEKHKLAAQMTYRFFGASIPYRTEEGVFAIYTPTEKDRQAWIETQETEAKVKETKAKLDWSLQQLPFLSGLYIGSFFVLTTAGALFLAYRRRAGSGHGESLVSAE